MAKSNFVRRQRARRDSEEDDERIARDGEIVRPSLFLLDAMQRSVAQSAQVTDGAELRKQAWLDRQERLSRAWCDPDGWYKASNRPPVTPPAPRQAQAQPQWFDYTKERASAYERRCRDLSQAWQTV